jgi:hypothetical protein
VLAEKIGFGSDARATALQTAKADIAAITEQGAEAAQKDLQE